MKGLRTMLIQCGPRFVRILKVVHAPNDLGPRCGGKWWGKIGTIVSWARYAGSVGRSVCDPRTDAARVGMEGHANWLEPRLNQHYQEWYDQLPQRQICAILPVYMYEWGEVVRVYTEPFQASPHVTSQCGWIYCTKKTINQKWPKLRYDPHVQKREAVAAMMAEIQELDLWLRDGAYRWRVEDIENRPGVLSGTFVAASNHFYGFNPNTNGMMATIPKQYKHLLEAWCNERGLS